MRPTLLQTARAAVAAAVAAFVIAGVIGSRAHAQDRPTTVYSYFTGNKLKADITSDVATLRIRGTAYILGVHDALSVLDLVCVPDGVTGNQLRDVMKLYLENNPQRLHYVAADLIETALLEAWPCEKQPARVRPGSGSF
jgi:hypothetical protein